MARPWTAPLSLRPRRRRIARALGMGAAALLLALILLGQLIFLVRTIQSGAWASGAATEVVPRTGSLSHRLGVVLNGALGPSDRGVRRFTITGIRPDSANRRLAVVSITWSINDDLSSGTIGNGAQGEVYLMLRDIYTSHLPIAGVRLDGTYPMPDRRGRTRESVVMRLRMSRSIAATIGRLGWDNLDAQEVWPLVERRYVNPALQPLSPE